MVNNRTVVTAALAVLAVLALGVSAATLDSATTTDNSGGFGAGSASGVGVGNDDGSSLPLSDPGNRSALALSGPSICVPLLTRPLVQLALVACAALFFVMTLRVVKSVVVSGIFTLSVLTPFGLVYMILTACTTGSGQLDLSLASGAANATGLGAGGGEAGMNAAGEAVSAPTALAAFLLVVAIVGSLALLFVSTGDDEDVADEEPDTPDPDRRAAVGVAAGEAADRLEADADLENEVYRAWREMTDLLDVERPASSTPAEFAAAAVEAGMDREDVLALTDVFEEVRYGGADPTAEREERAVAALRRIEAAYGSADDEDADAGATGGDR